MALPKPPFISSFGALTEAWLQWFSRVDQTVAAARTLGPTSARPQPKDAYLGMVYIDTDLGPSGSEIGRPIWAVKVEPGGVTWIDSDGVVV